MSSSPLSRIVGRDHPDRTHPSTLLVQSPAGPEHLVLRRNGAWVRFRARLFGSSLDRQLASGASPESTALLAARAETLVAPPARMALAQEWRDVVQRARRPPVTAHATYLPLCRDRIIGAEGDVGAMVRALTAPRPLSARGVASARWLLTDGAGPLYYRQSRTDLATALRHTTSQLQSVDGS